MILNLFVNYLLISSYCNNLFVNLFHNFLFKWQPDLRSTFEENKAPRGKEFPSLRKMLFLKYQ